MTRSSHLQKSEVGEVRPSQTMTTFGIGSIVDLPNLSVLVMGLDDWETTHCTEISEERLLQSVQSILGPQVHRFFSPPRVTESDSPSRGSSDLGPLIGIPVAPFPRWMVCSKCRLLAPISSGLFEPKVYLKRPDRTSYVHNCTTLGKSPLAVPARFLVTCERGHLDDFPWLEFVHNGPSPCKGPLYLYEVGASGEAADVELKCSACNAHRRMGQAFGPLNRTILPPCRGRRPHLRDMDPKSCDQKHVKPILQGASNLWFPVVVSALSVPVASDELGRLIEENWAVLSNATSMEVIKAFRLIGQIRNLNKFTDEQIWEAIRKKTEGPGEPEDDPKDLKSPEWKVLTQPSKAKTSKTFKLRPVEPPEEFASFFEKIVLVERLREVRTLIGFTRIISPRDFDTPSELPSDNRAKISRKDPTWLPACEIRGEGIFFQFSEKRIREWVTKNQDYERDFEAAHHSWYSRKGIAGAVEYPGIRYVLIHTFSHALIRQLAIECGYTSASIAERIYSRNPADGDPMAGLLIYTAAPDSEGTLGGLCALGEPDKLGRHIRRALEKLKLCSSDPLCSENKVGNNDKLHGASCHACSFLPETSCERGNKYLDRSALVPTMVQESLAFFG